MLYFKPANATLHNDLPVPYTAPIKAAIESRWVPASDEANSHYEFWGYVSLHGVIIWEAESPNRTHIKEIMDAVTKRIANFAARDASGVIDLYSPGVTTE